MIVCFNSFSVQLGVYSVPFWQMDSIHILKIKLIFEMLTVCGQQHSFSTHERTFLWKDFETENVSTRGGFGPPTFGCPMFWGFHSISFIQMDSIRRWLHHITYAQPSYNLNNRSQPKTINMYTAFMNLQPHVKTFSDHHVCQSSHT